MRKITAIAFIIIAAAALYVFSRPEQSAEQSQTAQDSEPERFEFDVPKKSAHYETNTPAHGAVLPGVPVNVVIDFNFDLAVPSSITILKDGKDYGKGEIKIDANKLAMRRDMDPGAPDGIYTVNYNACWPDQSCHDGRFQFAINRSSAADFMDGRGQSEVMIDMAEIRFAPQNLRISRGTKVIWKNNDAVLHYVNTDSHPAHTHFPALNSKLLNTGESFEFVFEKAGAYPYHCSAHEATMRGMVLVD